MVGAPAAADAVARAHRLPALRVGLHLVLVDGVPVLPAEDVSDLLREDGRFDPNMARAGLRFFALPRVRRQLAAEIRAQFEAFRATGLALDHVNGHKHFQLHPTVARLTLEIGREFGVAAMRLPAEPVAALRRAFPGERYRRPLYGPAISALRYRLTRNEIFHADRIFGIAWSGRMVAERLLALLPHVPEGLSEIYFHPAVERSASLVAAMPDYRHPEELAALTSPAVKARIGELGLRLTSYGEIAAAAR